jgi:hypothetical protein
VELDRVRPRPSGCDDSDAAREHQPTTVAQSVRDQGSACATAALGDAALAVAKASTFVTRMPMLWS